MYRFLSIVFVIVVLVAAGLLAYGLLLPAGPSREQMVQLKSGSSARHIAIDLEKAGIVRNRYAFLLWHSLHGRKPLKAGEFFFDHPLKVGEVYDRLARGDIYVPLLVVPEGFNLFGIAGAIENTGLGLSGKFLPVARPGTALVG